MRQSAYLVLLAGFLVAARTPAADDTTPLPALKGDVVTISTPEGIRVGLWGTKVTYPAPTLIVLSATIEESLGDPYFRQCGNALAEGGFLLVSLDLPGHGLERRDGEPDGLEAWRFRSDHGEDFVTPFTAQVRNVLDHLVDAGYSNPERIGACGTSRGGFMALQAMATDERIRAIAAFAPVTALSTLRFFDGATNVEHVDALSLYARAESLAGRSIWLTIGDRDNGVGTDDCITFARRVTTLSLKQSKPADVTLVISPEPKGHTTPKGSPELAATWLLDKLK